MRFLIYLFIVILLFSTLGIILFDTGLTQIQIDNIVKIVPAFFAAMSLVVTLSLFDRFGMKRHLYEKRIKAVLEVLEYYRGRIMFCYLCSENQVTTNDFLRMSTTMEFLTRRLGKSDDLRIFIVGDSVEEFNKAFDGTVGNPYLPVELNPPFFIHQHVANHNLPESYLVISSYSNRNNKVDFDNLYSVDDVGSHLTCRQFINVHERYMKKIKSWISSNADIKDLQF
jgi:hypothetical protein